MTNRHVNYGPMPFYYPSTDFVSNLPATSDQVQESSCFNKFSCSDLNTYVNYDVDRRSNEYILYNNCYSNQTACTPIVSSTKGNFAFVDAQNIREETLPNFNENRNVISDNFIGICASGSEILGNKMVSHQPKKRSGGRKPREEETQLPPEEEERRRLRRLRNKEAAARCRKKRLDQMTTLEMKVKELTEQQRAMEDELEQLAHEKDQLDFILRAHEPICHMRTGASGIANRRPPITTNADRNSPRSGQSSTGSTPFDAERRNAGSADGSLRTSSKNCDPILASLTLKSGLSVIGKEADGSSMPKRPSTLPLSTAAEAISLTSSIFSSTAGSSCTNSGACMPLQTPSTYDPLNAPTGFTPLSQTPGVSTFLAPFLCQNSSSSSPPISSQNNGNNNLETPVVCRAPPGESSGKRADHFMKL